jgi:DNA-binding XRE family transcriptional regulator
MSTNKTRKTEDITTDYEFGKWLLDNMLRRGMSCTDVAKALHATRQGVRVHIAGTTKPSYVWVMAYCWLFNEDIEKIWKLV